MPKETGLAGKTTGYGTRMPGMAERDARSFHDQLCRMACRIVPNLPIALALAPALSDLRTSDWDRQTFGQSVTV
jgi:hypothetical protein